MLRTLCLGTRTRPPSRTRQPATPSGRGPHPASGCCPTTAVSVFYYDFLRLSLSRPRGSSGGPSVSLLPFPLFPEAKRTHARVHTHATQATAASPRTTGNRNRRERCPPMCTRGACSEGSRGAGRRCPQKALPEEGTAHLIQEANPRETTGFLPGTTLCFVSVFT